MDRIQSAISKARESRGNAALAAPHRPPPTPAPPLDRVTEAWQAIEEFSPPPRGLERNRVLTYAGGPAAAAFDMMRTRVLQQMRTNNWRRLAITSPTSGSGKTTLVANLAFGLGRQADIRTGVVELDLRRPSLSRTIGLEPADLQFSLVLEGRAPMPDHLRRCGMNLVFGLSRRQASRTTELLQSETATAALAELETSLGLTLTIFDMPPMLGSDDMQAFAGKVDCVLLVAAAESTTIDEIDRCERDLSSQTNVLGVVLNKCRYTNSDYGYGY
jgi:protein-tyrosine kinase